MSLRLWKCVKAFILSGKTLCTLMDPRREALMERIQERLEPELNEVLENLKLHEAWKEVVFELPRRKFNEIDVRSSFSAAVYEYITARAEEEKCELRGERSEELFYTQLPFIAEMVITIQYLENHILDGKDGVKPARGLQWNLIKDKLLASHFLKDMLYGYVREKVFPKSLRKRDILEACMRRMFQVTEEGQWAERHWSNLQNVQHGISHMPEWSAEVEALVDYDLIEQLFQCCRKYGLLPARESFARFYLKRIFCTNAAFFSLLAECVMDIAGFKGRRWEQERKNIKRFASGYGMIGQMLNDIADYVPASCGQTSVAKTVEDAYSDLRNGNFTLPFLFAVRDFEDVKAMLARDLYDDKVQQQFLKWVKPGCWYEAIRVLRVSSEKMKQLICDGEFPPYNQLRDFLDVVYSRRYLKFFEIQ